MLSQIWEYFAAHIRAKFVSCVMKSFLTEIPVNLVIPKSLYFPLGNTVPNYGLWFPVFDQCMRSGLLNFVLRLLCVAILHQLLFRVIYFLISRVLNKEEKKLFIRSGNLEKVSLFLISFLLYLGIVREFCLKFSSSVLCSNGTYRCQGRYEPTSRGGLFF